MTVAAGCIASAAVAAHTTVPVQFIDGLPVVTVTLGDLRADFLVDTGGQIGITVPQPLAVAAAEVTLSADFEKREDAAGHVASVQKLTARSVVVGGAELGPVEGLVNYQWGLSVGDEAAPSVTKKGVIGFKALSAKNILFDFPHNALVLFDRHEGGSPDVAGWEKTPFEYDARGVIVKIQVDGIDAALSLDTAATNSMIKRNALLFSKHKSRCAKKEAAEQFCGILNLEAKANGASLGRMQFAVVQMGDIPFDGLIGSEFFNSHRVFVDFDSKTLYVEKRKR